jgi:uncharacterized membrane protein
MKSKRIIFILGIVTSILLIPLIAMQFTQEVNWTLSDFIVAGVLLLVAGLGLELVLQKVNNKENRIAFYALIIIVLLLIWAELAVGIFGTPLAGN